MNIEKILSALRRLKKELEKYPTGCIVTRHKNGHDYYGHQYVIKKEKKENYIRLSAIDAWREKFRKRNIIRDKIKEYQEMLKPYKKEVQKILENQRLMRLAWKKCQTLPHPENYKHYTLHGEFVISKSEALIADYLYLHHIEYEYSKEIRLGNVAYHPDFTLFIDGTEIYLEHLGRLDDAAYAADWEYKKRQYDNFGLIEGLNLICTREHNGAINMQEIHQIFVSWGIVKR